MSFRLPLLDWLSQYRADWLRPDVLAGLTTAAVVIPKAMAYATVAGLPVEIGIYTAIVPALVYAVLGTSRVLSVTTTTTIAILVGTELTLAVPDGDTVKLLQALATLALLVGIVLGLASVLRLGFFADFVSYPVQVGFKAGIGFVIVADQVPKLLGIKIHKEGFFRDVWSIFEAIPRAVLLTVVVGFGTIAALALIKHFAPKWPAPLIVLGAAIAATALWALQSRGVSVVGAVPSGLPSFRLPDLSLAQAMWPGALGIALMSFTESIAVGRAFARTDDPLLKPNGELLATGAANAIGGFLGAMPAGGGASQTAMNRGTGARTQVSCVASAVV
ncbi:MAG TPA: SulP family inorganic anion transporter, partial [Steroidobacteraceae bacterium]